MWSYRGWFVQMLKGTSLSWIWEERWVLLKYVMGTIRLLNPTHRASCTRSSKWVAVNNNKMQLESIWRVSLSLHHYPEELFSNPWHICVDMSRRGCCASSSSPSPSLVSVWVFVCYFVLLFHLFPPSAVGRNCHSYHFLSLKSSCKDSWKPLKMG